MVVDGLGNETKEGVSQPLVRDFEDPVSFLRARLKYRRFVDPSFSLNKACQSLHRCSKGLVSMVLARKRVLTLDRVEDFASLMGLAAREKAAFRDLVARTSRELESEAVLPDESTHRSKAVSLDLLSDWLNVYVKDAFRFPALQRNPELVVRFLSTLASKERILRSMRFLLREGYLRRRIDGRLVEESPLSVAESDSPAKAIRQFHKRSLQIAKEALDIFGPDQRVANALVVPLSRREYERLAELVDEFGEKLKDFARTLKDVENSELSQEGEQREFQLYQIVVNVVPVGGIKLEEPS